MPPDLSTERAAHGGEAASSISPSRGTMNSIFSVCDGRYVSYKFTNSLEQQDEGFRPAALTHRRRPITLHLARRILPLPRSTERLTVEKLGYLSATILPGEREMDE